MNSILSAVVLSVLVGVALSSDCTTVCQGGCNLAKTTCDASMVLGPLCGLFFAQCNMGCGSVCGCQDGCAAQCQTDFDTCKTNAGQNLLFLFQCAIQNDACVAQCEEMCAIQRAIETVQGILGGGAAPASRK